MTALKSKYRIGQIVLLNIEFYSKGERYKQRFQEITAIEPWGIKGVKGFCLTFANGDRCHEKNVKPLTKLQRGK